MSKKSLTKMSVAEARKRLREELGEGTTCLCCDRPIKQYAYNFHAHLAEALIKLVRVSERNHEWVHVTYVDPTRHLAKAEHWGLVEQKRHPETNRRVPGFWRPTKKGNDFVYKNSKVPSHVILLKNKVQGFSETNLTIIQALGGRSIYEDLMAAL